jgi:Icc-related predicted phosphoesterase
MKIVVISDTHTLHNEILNKIPPADVLIHCGDFSEHDLVSVVSFNEFLGELSHIPTKIVIPGNHDRFVERNVDLARATLTHCHFLLDESITIDGINFYGSPWQPEFFDWAYNLPRKSPMLQERWDAIPTNTDVLITHGPPNGICDLNKQGQPTGCELLRETILGRVMPKFHLFGHIHEAYGSYNDRGLDTTFINASICNLNYKPINDPVIIEL